MTHQQETDLAIFHSKCENIRKIAFYEMNDALNMDDFQLCYAGFETNQDAAIEYFKYAQKQILELTKEYSKKRSD